MRQILQQLVGMLGQPLFIALLFMVAGALAGWRRQTGLCRWLLVLACFLIFLPATPYVGGALIRPLERRYMPVADARLPRQTYAIVVLGSAYAPKKDVPVTGALSEEGLRRIVEAVRLARMVRVSRFVVSGGPTAGQVASAVGYQRLAEELGVPARLIVALTTPRDTSQEAQTIGKTLGKESFLLVTSASHMPRAMLLMRRAGLDAIPVPTGQHAAVSGLEQFIPSAMGLRLTELALHEYLGLAAVSLGFE